MSLNLNDIVTDGSAKFQVVKNATTSDITNAVNNFANELGYRQKNKTYAEGDIAYHSDLPIGWYLECTIAGTSGSGDITLTSTIGSTVSDGTVTWTVKPIFEYYHAHLTDCDDAKFSGIYAVPPTANNAPSNQWSQMITIGDGQTIQQLAIQLSEPTIIFARAKSGAATIFSQWTQQEAIVAKSIGENGYIKYTSGLIIQWSFGYANNDTAGYASNTFPISFTSGYRAIAMAVNSSDATMNVVSTSSSTNSRLFLKTNYPGGIQVVYIAIGY